MVLTFEKPRIYVRAENEIPRERKLRIKFLPLLEAHIQAEDLWYFSRFQKDFFDWQLSAFGAHRAAYSSYSDCRDFFRAAKGRGKTLLMGRCTNGAAPLGSRKKCARQKSSHTTFWLKMEFHFLGAFFPLTPTFGGGRVHAKAALFNIIPYYINCSIS